jgi:uncharacterized protein YceK
MAVVLTMVSLTLTGCGTVNRPISQTETYTWSYSYAGADLKPVCKKVNIAIARDRQQGASVNSVIVPDSYCKQAKPFLFNNAG